MAVSKKPIIWSLFAAGGTITAFLMPLLVLVAGIAVPMGWLEAETFGYTQIQSLFGNPLIRLILFGILFLSVWHAAHRMRITVHDFGVRADMLAATVFYSIAFVATIILAIALI